MSDTKEIQYSVEELRHSVRQQAAGEVAEIINRLATLQRTDVASRETALAITKLEEAVHWLEHHGKDRKKDAKPPLVPH